MPARFATSLLVAATMLVAGCTVKKTEAPPPSGPSELSTSLQLQATPDVLPQDGASTSQVVIFARDANGKAIPSLPLRIDILVNGTVQDFGTLSSKSPVTGVDGRALVTYTAPVSADSVDSATTVTIQATPAGTDARAAVGRTVDIRLVPTGVVTPPETAVPDFSMSPEAPLVLQTVLFDASDASLDGNLTSYLWTFGDGGSSSGRATNHQFRTAGTFVVTLRVTDRFGKHGSRAKTITIDPGEVPLAAFTFSPAAPRPNDVVFFNGVLSTAAPGRRITKYEWNFGDGGTATGSAPSHRFTVIGTYNVTLKVTDDAGNIGAATQGVTVTLPEE